MNILLLFNDDHAQWALGAYGNRELRTPTLDYLASTGAVMENAFTPTPVCSPARASLMTGLLPCQHGLHDYIASGTEFHKRRWLDGEETLPDLLSRAGYQVGLSGKWHLGNDEQPHPGFDYWFALNGDYPIQAAGHHRYSIDGAIEGLAGYKTQIITDRAVDYLRGLDRDRPFFLFVGHTATHSPWADHPERLVAQYRRCDFADVPQGPAYPFGVQALESAELIDRFASREALAQYYAAVSCLDEATGRLLDELDALDLMAETLIVYTSDHGLCCGQHGIWGKGNGTLPLNMLEENIRVPLIIHNEARLFGPQRRIEFADHLDLFQTLIEAAGLERDDPSNRYPGRSFWPLLTNRALTEPWRDAQFGEYGTMRMIRTNRHKLIKRYPDGPCELFDLKNDPGETANLHGDPDQRVLLVRLTERLEDHFGRFEDPTDPTIGEMRISPTNLTSPWNP